MVKSALTFLIEEPSNFPKMRKHCTFKLLGIPLPAGLGGLAPPSGPLFLTTPFALWTLQIKSICQVGDCFQLILLREKPGCLFAPPQNRSHVHSWVLKQEPRCISIFETTGKPKLNATTLTAGKSRQSSSATLGSIS